MEPRNSEHDELKREGERGEAADRSVPFNPHPNGTIHSPDPISICNKICHNRLIKKNKEAEELIKGSLEVKQAAIQKYYSQLLADPSLHLPFQELRLQVNRVFQFTFSLDSSTPTLTRQKGIICLPLNICRFTVPPQHPTAGLGTDAAAASKKGAKIPKRQRDVWLKYQ